MLFNKVEIESFVMQQLVNIFGCHMILHDYMDDAIQRTKYSFEFCANKYYDSNMQFSTFNSAQYCVFLYNLSRVMYEKDQNGSNSEKIYYLNKTLNAIDLFYAVEMPRIWCVEHSLGSVMGRAEYSDRFFFYQGCTVGGNKGCYPKIGSDVLMYSHSKILGKSTIGSHVIVSANTYIKDTDIPDNCIVFGQYPNLTIKVKSEHEITELTKHIWRQNLNG